MTDVNDNAPKFELPDYQAHNVDEDIPLGTSILKVKAMDADSGANAEIEYLVSDDHFAVDSNGIIVNNKQLDADNNNAYYEFVVTAKDKGEPSKTGTATVRVYTKNKNDEEPKFSQQVYTPNVDENAGPNTLVTTVVASDKDGDNVRFGFVGGGSNSGQFVIEEITGVIRLHNKAISLDRDKYELNVTAMDDGSCCNNGESTIHTSTAVVVVFITDVNDNKPIFKDCGTYYPKVEEGAPNGSPVIKVQATDEDKGVNGQVSLPKYILNYRLVLHKHPKSATLLSISNDKCNIQLINYYQILLSTITKYFVVNLQHHSLLIRVSVLILEAMRKMGMQCETCFSAISISYDDRRRCVLNLQR